MAGTRQSNEQKLVDSIMGFSTRLPSSNPPLKMSKYSVSNLPVMKPEVPIGQTKEGYDLDGEAKLYGMTVDELLRLKEIQAGATPVVADNKIIRKWNNYATDENVMIGDRNEEALNEWQRESAERDILIQSQKENIQYMDGPSTFKEEVITSPLSVYDPDKLYFEDGSSATVDDVGQGNGVWAMSGGKMRPIDMHSRNQARRMKEEGRNYRTGNGERPFTEYISDNEIFDEYLGKGELPEGVTDTAQKITGNEEDGFSYSFFDAPKTQFDRERARRLEENTQKAELGQSLSERTDNLNSQISGTIPYAILDQVQGYEGLETKKEPETSGNMYELMGQFRKDELRYDDLEYNTEVSDQIDDSMLPGSVEEKSQFDDYFLNVLNNVREGNGLEPWDLEDIAGGKEIEEDPSYQEALRVIENDPRNAPIQQRFMTIAPSLTETITTEIPGEKVRVPQEPVEAMTPMGEEEGFLDTLEYADVPPMEKTIPDPTIIPVKPPPPDKKEDDPDHLHNMATLFGALANGMERWNMEGFNIPIPQYEPQRYKSPQMEQAVQNQYRG